MLSVKILCVGIISTILVHNAESCANPELEIFENGVSHKDIVKIVNQHNQYRQAIMDGSIPGQPKGVGLKHLKWDDKLAKSAQDVADKCVFKHSNFVDERWKQKVGENIFRAGKQFFESNNSNWTQAIESWFSEHVHYHYGPFGKGYDKYGHYTALIWDTTEFVGCGYAAYDNDLDPNLEVNELYVCQYGPPGNYFHKYPYRLASGYEKFDKNGDDIQTIVDRHNFYRQAIVDGKVPGQPRGVGLKYLRWDEQLAEMAQEVADSCEFPRKRLHDSRFRLGPGNNVAYVWKLNFIPNDANWTGAVEIWFNAYKQYHYKKHSPRDVGIGTGSYTQIVWADTEFIGCGFNSHNNPEADPEYVIEQTYVCLYGPTGNQLGKYPYKKASKNFEREAYDYD
ncbi:cysteine-rich secretory protein-related [Holotrichia oblita]|uniref:Cysteine-rich secretory protein-related n=1 Tax=Holotrichia oblita TaxID=644536 RepID=A0ACB9TZ74_HOLOL|nr:cysteine-rich secretory protein-related [Holotrichia oblita]